MHGFKKTVKFRFGWVRLNRNEPDGGSERFGSCAVRFLPVPRFMLARGHGGVQVLEHLGLKVLKTCTPPRARGNAGEYRACAVFVWWEGNLHSLLLRRSNKQGWGCWAGDAGESGFGTFKGPESPENLYSPACPW